MAVSGKHVKMRFTTSTWSTFNISASERRDDRNAVSPDVIASTTIAATVTPPTHVPRKRLAMLPSTTGPARERFSGAML